jgi:hypothetical protein
MTRWVVSLFLFSLLFFSAANLSLADTPPDTVAGLVFSTEPQSVEPGAISGMLTIQTVDAGGNPSNIGETGDLTFTSTSPTGEFVNESGSPVTRTMNRGTHSRNFYYRDSTAGSYTLTVTLTGRTSLRSWTATQSIGVGQPAESGGEQNTPAQISSNSSGDDNSETVKKTTSSSPLKLDVLKVPPSVVGAPVVFKSKVTGTKKSDTESLAVHWSFGDGAEAYGPTVYHAYQFAGKYVVVVVATSGSEEVMTRLVVEVGEPTLEISAVSVGPVPYVQLVNKSGKEIDLGNWRLSDAVRGINLPVNTIISANSKLNLPVESTKLVLAGAVSLVSPVGQVVATHGAVAASAPAVTPETQAKITNLEANIKQLVAQVDTMARQEWAAKQASKVAAVSTVDVEPAARVIPDAAVEVKPETKPDVVELPKKSTVLGQGWERLKAVFYNKK